MIVLEPIEGLCNRMRALDSALALAEATGDELHVVWYADAALNCRFAALFQRPSGLASVAERAGLGPMAKASRMAHHVCARLTHDVYAGEETVREWATSGRDVAALLAGRRAYIRTHSRFYPSRCPFAALSPIPSLERAIAGVSEGLVGAVGVHIRRGDNARSSANSPTDAFVALMRQELDADRSTRFFLATDAEEEEQALRRVFPGRIITYPKRAYDRRDPRAIQDALVDLYCLAACRTLIGSYWSSFSDVAWQIRGIPHVTASDSRPR